jgi:mono/diheme cytochrome c family protein
MLLAAVLLFSACEEDHAAREWQPEDHQPPSGGADPSQAEPAEGANATDAAAVLWRVRCAGCHGVEGRGDGPAAPPVATIPDLTSAEVQGRTDEQMAAVIRDGRGMMPGFGSQLNERGIAALVAHMRTFRAD